MSSLVAVALSITRNRAHLKDPTTLDAPYSPAIFRASGSPRAGPLYGSIKRTVLPHAAARSPVLESALRWGAADWMEDYDEAIDIAIN